MLDIIQGDALAELRRLPEGCAHCCVTSPPYWNLRDYGVDGQIGLEPTPDAYVSTIADVFREVRRVLAKAGTLWLNLGDSYSAGTDDAVSNRRDRTLCCAPRLHGKNAGLPPKNLMGMPWRVAFALQADGWTLRRDIIWHKPNAMPETVKDRPTCAHEYLFLFSKSRRYYYDGEVIKTAKSPNAHNGYQPDRANARTVWSIPTRPYAEAHFATFPEDLVAPCILAGCPPGGTVLDPFMGAGTTPLVALKTGRGVIGIEINPEYIALARKRLEPILTQPDCVNALSAKIEDHLSGE